MNILNAIKKSYVSANKKGYDTIYWAIDLHDTIIPANYKNDLLSFYPYSLECLKLLSKDKNIKLIFYSCSYEENALRIIEELKGYEINFDYFNENPEAKNTKYGDYSKKPYYNVLLDDKAGFEPENDWREIYQYLKENVEFFNDIYLKN